jgi:hypothetical protein
VLGAKSVNPIEKGCTLIGQARHFGIRRRIARNRCLKNSQVDALLLLFTVGSKSRFNPNQRRISSCSIGLKVNQMVFKGVKHSVKSSSHEGQKVIFALAFVMFSVV